MRLSFSNIGKVAKADIEIDGIAVVAGENDTGKSTIGKVLYSVFESFRDVDESIQRIRRESLENALRDLVKPSQMNPGVEYLIDELAVSLMGKKQEIREESDDFLKKEIITYISDNKKDLDYSDLTIDGKTLDGIVERVKAINSVDKKRLLSQVIANRFAEEFNDQINNIYSKKEAEIKLAVAGDSVRVSIKDDQVVNLENVLNLSKTPVYIDGPSVLERNGMFIFGKRGSHDYNLQIMLRTPADKGNVIDEILASDKLEAIEEIINTAFPEKIEMTGRFGRAVVAKEGEEAKLDARNLSSGVKTFAILKQLLLNGCLQQKGTIILDEPEIHLHPEWQLVYAKTIVLLQKMFDMHVLLTTHSPYFLEAIEVYSAQEGIADRCHYYLARNEDASSFIFDVTGDTEQIYKQLACPLQELENLQYQ